MLKAALCTTGTAAPGVKGEQGVRHVFSRGLRIVAALCVALAAQAASGQTPVSDREGGARRARPTQAQPKHAVTIKRPAGTPQVATGKTNFLGQPVMASCSSCHTTTKPNIDTRSTADLDQFHQGLKYAHGNLSCLSCHNSKDYETLRLADSRELGFTDSMALCSQCHGPQKRDYDMGLHGGMNGHWDLARGGRTRNTCINCHDPHAPAFPTVMPVLPPRDRISVHSKAPAHAPATHPHP